MDRQILSCCEDELRNLIGCVNGFDTNNETE